MEFLVQKLNNYKLLFQLPASLGAILIVVILGISIIAVSFHGKFIVFASDSQEVAHREILALVSVVSKLIILPKGELPTIATVADPELLKGQPLFAKAKKGDRVLIYTNARKAILYDPIDNKIVEVAPINIEQVSE